MSTDTRFDVDKLVDDLAARGWLPTDLARAAQLSDMTISRVLKGQRHNPRTWKQIADALGKNIRRYTIRRAA
ncbi:MAG TPA: helix-turn-helix transcriptional regulator [Candidatus Limnocylindrales bacterium]|nr:helix-turn-helix transcriptional regulator [Candidatus Limnocylindrales bacterium]